MVKKALSMLIVTQIEMYCLLWGMYLKNFKRRVLSGLEKGNIKILLVMDSKC